MSRTFYEWRITFSAEPLEHRDEEVLLDALQKEVEALEQRYKLLGVTAHTWR